MRIFIYITAFILSISALAEDNSVIDEDVSKEKKFYKKVNPDGTIEFTDVPDKGSQEIEVKPTPSIKLRPVPAITPYQTPKQPALYRYQKFEIVTPANDAAIRDNAGNITVVATLEPTLQRMHRIKWLLDGNVVAGQGGLSLTLSNVDRGAHRVQAQVLDVQGQVLGSTQETTFHMMRFFKPPAKAK